jgi:hypothetical protein
MDPRSTIRGPLSATDVRRALRPTVMIPIVWSSVLTEKLAVLTPSGPSAPRNVTPKVIDSPGPSVVSLRGPEDHRNDEELTPLITGGQISLKPVFPLFVTVTDWRTLSHGGVGGYVREFDESDTSEITPDPASRRSTLPAQAIADESAVKRNVVVDRVTDVGAKATTTIRDSPGSSLVGNGGVMDTILKGGAMVGCVRRSSSLDPVFRSSKIASRRSPTRTSPNCPLPTTVTWDSTPVWRM